MKYLSICSGIEAATAAWKPLGWQAVAFSEIDPFCCDLLAHHYPNVPNMGDMTKYKEWKIDESVDVIIGGTPCQSFSVAGLRKGLDDPRGNLALVFLGIVDRFKPRWVVWENVPGVLSDRTNAFGQFLGGLRECGYSCGYRVLDAQYFGLAQRRKRVFVVGYSGDWRRAAAVLLDGGCLRGCPAPSRKRQPETQKHIKEVFALQIHASPERKDQINYDISPTCTKHRSNIVLMSDDFCRYAYPREVERLFSFPDDYTLIPRKNGKLAADAPRYAALGNSIAVPVLKWLGKRIEIVDKMVTT